MTINLNQSYIDKTNFIQTLNSAIRTLQSERWIGRIVGGKITLGLTELVTPKNLAIIGDLHGDFRSLMSILKDLDFENFLSNPENKMVFLGDYVDRGSSSVEVFYRVCYLKEKYPDSVILMRGNHEATAEFPCRYHDLPAKVQEYFGTESRDQVYKKILEVFQLLTLVTIVGNKLFLVHGGLPISPFSNYKEQVSVAAQNHDYRDILEDILCNDPRPVSDKKNWEPSRRGFGKHFGAEISRKWLKISRTKAIVRSHEPCQMFKIDNECTVMTIFSCKESYPNFEAGYLFLTASQL